MIFAFSSSTMSGVKVYTMERSKLFVKCTKPIEHLVVHYVYDPELVSFIRQYISTQRVFSLTLDNIKSLETVKRDRFDLQYWAEGRKKIAEGHVLWCCVCSGVNEW